jgi:nicotinamidase-related amidase
MLLIVDMDPHHTALLLIGYQNDYFASDGVLHRVIEETSRISDVLANTLDLLERLSPTPVTIFSTPIVFTPGYSELVEPVGILKTIKEVGAFQAGKKGSEMTPELHRFAGRIVEVPGKRGFNAFSDTALDAALRQRNIKNIIIAGVVTSICVDSTGRSASEKGYRTTVLSDCTSARTAFEQDFYCQNVLPLYATVMDRSGLMRELGIDS